MRRVSGQAGTSRVARQRRPVTAPLRRAARRSDGVPAASSRARARAGGPQPAGRPPGAGTPRRDRRDRRAGGTGADRPRGHGHLDATGLLTSVMWLELWRRDRDRPTGEAVQATSGAVAGTVASGGSTAGSAVSGAANTVAGTVGAVNGTVGNTVNQAGQAVAGTITSATNTAAGVVSGAGQTVSGLLGGH